MDEIITSDRDLQRLLAEQIKEALPRALADLQPPASEVKKEVLSNREAQKFLDASKSTLQRWRDSGLLPFSKVERTIFYRREDLLAVVDAHRVAS